MGKVIKRIVNIVFVAVVLLLAAYTFLMAKYPDETARFTGFRLYAVLTDSMEPRIPTFSLVCTRVIDPDEPLHLKKGDIITFKADRFGDDILLTHHFNKTEKDFQGNTIYRTNAEGKDNLDMYKTLRKDIIGTYVFHIPFIGKIFLFLKSKFGILLYAELAVIWLFNKTIRTRWAEKEQVLKNRKHSMWMLWNLKPWRSIVCCVVNYGMIQRLRCDLLKQRYSCMMNKRSSLKR